MKFFIKVTLCGVATCLMSVATIGIGYSAVCFIKEALQSYGIGAIFLFLFSLILIVATVLALFMTASITHILAEKAEEHQDKVVMKIAKVFHDIANEEKVHIGELKKCLELIGVSDKEQQEGENEVEEIVGNVGEV